MKSYRSLLSSLIAAAIAVPGACGGKTSSPAQGDDASAGDGAGSGGSSGSGTLPGSGSSGGAGSSGSSGSNGSSGSGTSSSGVGVYDAMLGDDVSGSSGGTGSSGGSGSSSSGGCGGNSYLVDPTMCVPQLSYENGCNGVVCGWTVELPCNAEGGAVGDAGPSCDALCTAIPLSDAGPPQPGTFGCSLVPTSDGRGVVAQCSSTSGFCIGGRAPRGFAPAAVSAVSAAGAYLARMAQLEAASVDAFQALDADLTRLGAPRALLAAVRAAARDEVRHARVVGSLAARFGAKVPPVSVPAASPRSVEDVAIENAVEGCVREAFGAAIAAVQSERASDPRVRRAMRVIAREELGHAALAWRVAHWLESRLDAAARRRVAVARLEALRELASSMQSGNPEQDAIGLPDARAARAVLERMWTALESGDLANAA